VLVFGAGPTATETLKNLVLPGLGRFTIVDGMTVGSADLGNNFFVTPESHGRPRAEVVRDLLVEMNPDDCVGTAKVADPAALVASEPEFISDFSLVIATMMEPTPLATLGSVRNVLVASYLCRLSLSISVPLFSLSISQTSLLKFDWQLLVTKSLGDHDVTSTPQKCFSSLPPLL
jgi:hypothetical protein